MDQIDENRTYALLFAVRRSVRYHDRRRRFYEIWNSITVGAATVGGSSAVTAFLAMPESAWLPPALAAIVAFMGAIDLVVGTARSANRHGDLARQFISLEMKFAHGHNLEDSEHDELVRERLRIEASEPTALRLLDVMCHYDILLSEGEESPHPSIPWLRRMFANLCSQADYARRCMQPKVS